MVAPKPTKKAKKPRNKRYLWSNALHVRFLIAMVDWAEKNADVTKLHTLMGAVGQKLCTEKELATHKATAGRLNAPIRADFIALTDAQITADYNNPEKMHQPSSTTPTPVCFTDFPVRPYVPAPAPPFVKTSSASKRAKSRKVSVKKRKREGGFKLDPLAPDFLS